jgi:hypothetical protein
MTDSEMGGSQVGPELRKVYVAQGFRSFQLNHD